jgi:anti-sigma regulatory factor (Ser/Thr protein kinase)
LHLRVSADPEQLSSIRASLRGWLTQAGVGASEAAEVVLAAGEACANAIEHAYNGTSQDGTVAVEARFVDTHELVVAVHDSGRWRTGNSSHHRGRGLGIMRALASRLDIARGDRGTTVTMWRHLSRDRPA